MSRRWSFLVLLLAAAPASAQDMTLPQILVEGESWRSVAEGFHSIQGLAADGEGNLYVADADSHRVERIDREGRATPFVELDSGPGLGGLAFGPGGDLYVCRPGSRAIVIVDPKGRVKGQVADLAAQALVVTRSGVVYCTVPSERAIYLVDRDGKKRKVDEEATTPAGLTLWPDEGTLVVGDAEGKNLWAFRIEPDGSLTARERYYSLPRRRHGIKDGAGEVTTDSRGRVYLAGSGGVEVFDPTGRLIGVLRRAADVPSRAIVFGGPGRDVLYVACGSTVYGRKTKAQGLGR